MEKISAGELINGCFFNIYAPKAYLKNAFEFVFQYIHLNGLNSLHVHAVYFRGLHEIIHWLISSSQSKVPNIEPIRPGNLITGCLKIPKAKAYFQILTPIELILIIIHIGNSFPYQESKGQMFKTAKQAQYTLTSGTEIS